MKKRLSLLMVLMMIVSLLPMSAFADGKADFKTIEVTTEDSNKLVRTGFEFEKTGTITNVAAQSLTFELTGGATFASANGVSFGGGTVAGATFAPVSADSQFATAYVPQQTLAAGKNYLVFDYAVNFEDASGDIFLNVTDSSAPVAGADTVGNHTNTIKIATIKDSDTTELSISVRDAEKVMSFDGGKLSQFEIKNIPTTTTKLTLESDDGINFDDGTTVVGVGANVTTHSVTTGGKYEITLSGVTSKSSIIVVPSFGGVGRKAGEGNVNVYVETNTTPARTNRAVIGKLVDFALTMTVVENGKKELPNVWGGEEATVKVTIKGPKGSILARDLDFKVDGADVKYTRAANKGFTNLDPSNITVDGVAKVAISGSETTVFKDKEFTLKQGTTKFDTLEELSFVMVIKTDGDKDGVATITAMQRGMEVTADLAKVTPKFAAKADVTPVKKGEARDTADVTITEAKAGLLAKGERLNLTFDTRRDYTQITSKSVKIEATNGMTFDTSSSAIDWLLGNDGKKVGISVPITRSSAGEAAVITVTGINVAVDGSATDDVVALKTGLTDRDDKSITVSSPDYVKVVKEYDMESILSVFTIGQTAYTVNGVTKAAHSAPYIKAGRTMLPIRAVAESLGLEVQWNSATRTASFTDANKVAAVTIGSKVLYVNGTPMPLTVPAELVNDTTFVELRSLATAFGVQIDWDAAAKTATVSK